ncbi:MAG: hypothetical protein H7X93_06960 [Sphingomonadaceae bacterium]|nr:hypothetical protein [Sphingomonadaceae bacterium]
MNFFARLFPKQVDNSFDGHRAALWLLGLFIALKLVMSVNSIFNTASIATGDGIPLDSFGPAAAREVLTLFALMALGQLALALIALAILIRYRALVPLICLQLLGERIAGRFIVQSHAVAGAESPAIVWIMAAGLPTLLILALVLSLLPARGGRSHQSALNKEEGQ